MVVEKCQNLLKSKAPEYGLSIAVSTDHLLAYKSVNVSVYVTMSGDAPLLFTSLNYCQHVTHIQTSFFSLGNMQSSLTRNTFLSLLALINLQCKANIVHTVFILYSISILFHISNIHTFHK